MVKITRSSLNLPLIHLIIIFMGGITQRATLEIELHLLRWLCPTSGVQFKIKCNSF